MHNEDPQWFIVRLKRVINIAPMLHSHSKFVLQIEQSLSLFLNLFCDFSLRPKFFIRCDCVERTFYETNSPDCRCSPPIYLFSFRWKVRFGFVSGDTHMELKNVPSATISVRDRAVNKVWLFQDAVGGLWKVSRRLYYVKRRSQVRSLLGIFKSPLELS